ncbi:hypothetical protein [Gelatiniphilus marinus]|uniref:DUF922 domain-containing protein n=1 Tax=Gelatiniphilus marinus TaxID=1759464 RepID=A0ABW5JQ45_9FLAO
MKLNLLISFLIIFSHFGFSQNEILNDTLIAWNKTKKLEWTDFKGKPKKEPVYVIAETQCHIKYTGSYYDNNGVPKFSIKCFFSKNESWTVVNDLETLKHEQLHFDLWELITRKIRKAFSDLNAKSEKNVSLYYEKYSEMIKYGSELQNQYDNESYFNKDMQNYWNERISKELKNLSKYEI